MKRSKIIFTAIIIIAISNLLIAEPNNGHWAESMTFVYLKNLGLVNNYNIDFSKTKTTRLLSEKIGNDLYKQMYFVRYFYTNGNTIDVLAMHNASDKELSMSDVEIFIISEYVNKYGVLTQYIIPE